MTSILENFKHPTDAHAIAARVMAAYPDADAQMLTDITRMISERDRALEDYLNQHVVRRARSNLFFSPGAVAFGTGTYPAYALVVTSTFEHIEIPFTKASDHSELRIETYDYIVAGVGGGGSSSWLSFGVVIENEDSSGTLGGISDSSGRVLSDGLVVELARFGYDDGDRTLVAGSNGVFGVPAGKWRAVLVAASPGGVGAITVTEEGSFSLSVTESPA